MGLSMIEDVEIFFSPLKARLGFWIRFFGVECRGLAFGL